MIRSHWHESGKLGEHHLNAVAVSVRKWDRYCGEQSASLGEGVSGATREVILRDFLFDMSTQAMGLDEDIHLLDRQAEVTVAQPGVFVKRSLRNIPLNPNRVTGYKEAAIERVIRGRITHLSNSPMFGGAISLVGAFGVTNIYGLVNPETGEHQVNLAILTKNHN
jgi:hypothetical protein